MNLVVKRSILPVVLVGVMSLTGCTSASKQGATGGATTVTAAVPAAPHNPPLVVPQTFANNDAKRDFAIKAVGDGYYAEAKPLLEESAAQAPAAITWMALGTTRYNLKDYTGAIDAWNAAARLDASLSGEMENNIGNALRHLNRDDDAVAAYKQALEIEPTRWTAATNLAVLLDQKDQTTEAIAILAQAEEHNRDVKPLSDLLDSLKKKASEKAQK